MRGTFPDRPGALYVARVHRGHAEVCVYPLMFGGGRILLGPTGDAYDGGADLVWDYECLDDALSAAHRWDGLGHPEGAYRHADRSGRWQRLRPLKAAA